MGFLRTRTTEAEIKADPKTRYLLGLMTP